MFKYDTRFRLAGFRRYPISFDAILLNSSMRLDGISEVVVVPETQFAKAQGMASFVAWISEPFMAEDFLRDARAIHQDREGR